MGEIDVRVVETQLWHNAGLNSEHKEDRLHPVMIREPLSRILAVGILVGCGARAWAAPDDPAKPAVDLSIYRHAIHVGWVVKDLDGVLDYWEKLGLKNIQRLGIREMPDRTYRGKKLLLRRKTAWGNIGGVAIEWVEPVEGENASTEFLRRHGDGIHHLAYAVQSSEQLDAQIRYFHERGVEAIEQGSWQSAKGRGRMAYIDTAGQGGGLDLELVYDPDAGATQTAARDANDYPFNRIAQYAILVRDSKKVAGFWQRLGFGGTSFEHNISVNRNYRGRPGQYEMWLGFWNWPDVTFEWIEPLRGPSVYDEYLKAHGEGLHHLGFEVKDFDAAVKMLEAKGAPVSQSGGWEDGSRGRFVYLDTEPHGGVTIELLWNEQ